MNTVQTTVETFWQKNRVIITGFFVAVLTALAPILMVTPDHQYDWRIIIISAATASAGYFGNDKRGKNWSMSGQVAAALLAFASTYEGNLDWVRIILAVVFAWFAIPIPDTKLNTYEKTPVIEQAKEQAAQMKVVTPSETVQSQSPKDILSNRP